MSGPKSAGAHGFGPFVAEQPYGNNVIPLHRGVRRIPFEHMARHDPEAAFQREPTKPTDLIEWERNRIGFERPWLRVFVAWASVFVAVFCVAYFALEFAR